MSYKYPNSAFNILNDYFKGITFNEKYKRFLDCYHLIVEESEYGKLKNYAIVTSDGRVYSTDFTRYISDFGKYLEQIITTITNKIDEDMNKGLPYTDRKYRELFNK